jgi:transcriptional regulator with XRE-family HTH domain
MTLGGLLKAAREARGLSRAAVAREVRMARQAYAQVEDGRVLDLKLGRAVALAGVLGLDLEVLAEVSYRAFRKRKQLPPLRNGASRRTKRQQKVTS